ncbi:hypothetical protein [Phytomonospora endophytica]|uniref:Uncharacterized protein n=1 Tax=Phytomonospora endophytica TaxID=714109 RepID=A0A841FJK9_9ACTN|nr:hypothetical protein [Phytomonospora endophytica]MBB6036064.1 hypothetical protein [Phytomonospora endophytica]
MTNRSASSQTPTLSADDKAILRTAAYGAVPLLAYADVAGSPHKAVTNGSLALTSATGTVGHVLAARTRDVKLKTRSAAALADQVLPALSAGVRLLKAKAPTEAANFRGTVLVAVEAAAQAGRGASNPTVAAMVGKVKVALDAA